MAAVGPTPSSLASRPGLETAKGTRKLSAIFTAVKAVSFPTGTRRLVDQREQKADQQCDSAGAGKSVHSGGQDCNSANEYRANHQAFATRGGRRSQYQGERQADSLSPD